MNKGILRRSVPKVKRAIFFALVLAIGFLVYSLQRETLVAAGAHELVPALLYFVASWAAAALVAILLFGGSRLFADWDRELADEDLTRCVDCDGTLQRPFFRETRDGGRFVCGPCARTRGWASGAAGAMAAKGRV